jgi:Domain of unknown function (DUF4954)
LVKTGETLVANPKAGLDKLEIVTSGFENSNRPIQLIKAPEACREFNKMIIYYGVTRLIDFIERKKINSWQALQKQLPAAAIRKTWKNIGGLLVTEEAVNTLITSIHTGKINGWGEVHQFYTTQSKNYADEKFLHAWACLLEIKKIPARQFTKKIFIQLLQQAVRTNEWMTEAIYASRAKDYENPFRKMVYDTEEEMEKVIGKLKDNSFIQAQQAATVHFRHKAEAILKMMQ